MYDHKAIDKKWQEYWDETGIYKTPENPTGKKYILDMFPYPSGAGLHVGHPEGYTATDIVSRFLRMNGHSVLHPMGWDAFGLPAENYAIKQGVPPAVTTAKNIDRFREQIKSIGLSYDWSREINTSSPEYYKWTQWLFLRLYEKGLAYKKEAYVNWCPSCQTVLANEQVAAGECERCGSQVVQKLLSQWFFKITDYAERLLNDLGKLDWPDSIVAMQKNWIGKSEGAMIDFAVQPGGKPNFLILHGFTGSNAKNFIPWLKQELQNRGFEVQTPQLPNTDNPEEKEQVDYVLENCRIDDNTIIVGHSLGGIVAMKVIQKRNLPVRGLVLVAPAMDPNFHQDIDREERPYWKNFNWDFDFEKISQLAGFRMVLSDSTEQQRAAYLDQLAPKVKGALVTGTAAREHFCAEQEPMILDNVLPKITVFTTRPDTLFGATYLVLAPEYPLVKALTTKDQESAVNDYIAATAKKSELERTALEKVKTGVFTGSYAINPATKEKIPVWIADYVLTNYGTGAIMAVPAHDERDFEFAKKFELPIRTVVEPCFSQTTEPGKVREELPFKEREAIVAIVRNPKDNSYLGLKWKEVDWTTFITGGIETDQTPEAAARQEVLEETGYRNLKLVRSLDYRVHGKFYHVPKQENRFAHFHAFLFELDGEVEPEAISETELNRHEPVWLNEKDLGVITAESQVFAFKALVSGGSALYAGSGLLVNSGEYSGKDSEHALHEITQRFGKEKVQYKLRDWLVSRQRYWGAPIPIVYDPEGKPHPIPPEHLPWTLPTDVEFKPTGQSPLVYSKEFIERTERIFGQGWRPEYDTMDTFVDSSWYYLRFADPHNEKKFASQDEIKKWLPVDLYLGGAEHAVLHLLYARFFTKVLFDLKLVDIEEPFLKLRNQGLILGPDGEKMSKSRGNVINPDEVIDQYGADSFRMYEMFMGPLMDAKPWNTQGMIGVKRFLDRVCNFEGFNGPDNRNIHKLTKKVTDDIQSMKFNTSVSAFMEFLNQNKELSRPDWETFIKLLAPFAPHVAEEIWHRLGHDDSVHAQAWPKYNEAMVREENATIVVQILGRVRATLSLPANAGQEQVRAAALADENIKRHLEGKQIVKEIFVPDKLINFVVK